ncbi:MAG: hemerythrin domain-containing protein [Clostridiaceae bacterium]
MANIINLQRQHKEILETLNIIKRLIDIGEIETSAMDISVQINQLAGKLKMHLNSEDKYLYPDLLKSESVELKNIANEYINEMGDILVVFTEYKMKFNTRSKILLDTKGFLEQSKIIFSTIENRINKEEIGLYPLIK